MPRIDLLPPEYRAKQRQRRVLLIVLAAGGAFVVLLVFLTLAQRNRLSEREDELRREQARTADLRTQVAALQPFQQLQDDVQARRTTMAGLLARDVAFSKLLNDLSLIMPDNSWLSNATLAAAAGTAPNGQTSIGTVTFQGFVFDFPGLAGWLTRIAQVEGLTFVYLTSGNKQEIAAREVVSFGATASLTEPLLSRRCQEGKPCP